VAELSLPVTRSVTVADHLATMIEQWQEGDRLGTKKELCERLGVAHATLTEAIRLLQERGLVTMRPGVNGGIFVARPDPFARLGRSLLKVRDLPGLVDGAIEVRESLEALTVFDAMRHRTEADLVALQHRMTEVRNAIDNDDAFLRAIWRLHERIAEAGANTVLRTVYSGVLAYIDASTTDVVAGTKPRDYKQARLEAHQDLVDAIASQDEPACRAAIAAHDFEHRLPR
jgi:DNA-binding FadR family transcriptional regulator